MARRLIEPENHSSSFEIVFDRVTKNFGGFEPTTWYRPPALMAEFIGERRK
jgi:hypothetical protein